MAQLKSENPKGNNIDYVDEINKLKEQIEFLTNAFTSFQKDMEEALSTKENNIIEENTNNKSNDIQEKIVTDLDLKITNRKKRLPQYKPDIIIKTQNDKAKEDEHLTLETKSGNTNYLSEGLNERMQKTMTRTKSNKEHFIETLLNSPIIPPIGTFVGSIIGEMACKKKINVRDYLVNNPVKTYEEFVSKLYQVDPNVNDQTLELIKNDNPDNNMDKYNELLLNVYDNQQSLISYQLAKTINENDSNEYEIPYIKMDFSTYKIENNLKEILKTRGISHEKLAELIGTSRSTIVQIINNKGINLENAFKISYVLNIPLTELFSYKNGMNKMIEDIVGEKESD